VVSGAKNISGTRCFGSASDGKKFVMNLGGLSVVRVVPFRTFIGS
jgi:hypothetical protein